MLDRLAVGLDRESTAGRCGIDYSQLALLRDELFPAYGDAVNDEGCAAGVQHYLIRDGDPIAAQIFFNGASAAGGEKGHAFIQALPFGREYELHTARAEAAARTCHCPCGLEPDIINRYFQ